MKKKKVKIFITAFLIATALPLSLFAQKKESLALFPFTGGNASDGTAIVSTLARQAVLRNAFNRTTLVTQNTIATMNFEQRFQRDSGLTDADTIFELGKALNASHVIAGYITKLGDRNLVIVSIMDVVSLQQIAGDYRAYRTIEEIDALIPDIARKLAAAVPRNTSALPGLSVPPFNIASGVNQSEAMALAQILSCDLANSSKYAVLPRTDSIDKVMEEHLRQRDGTTDQERIKRLGVGRNAQFVLAGSVERLGSLNKFAVDILDILNGSFIDGYDEQYTTLSQGLELIPKLAAHIAEYVEGLLYEIVGGKSVTITKYIGDATSINIPSQIQRLPVTYIDSALSGSKSLTSITIPSSVIGIGDGAFSNCSSLTNINVDNRNPVYASIDGVLFDNNIQILVRYPQGRNQRTYVIPSSVRFIGYYAFTFCKSLINITIPPSVTYIGNRAFYGCSNLTNITIPSSVNSIGILAFGNCSSLTSINVDNRNPVYASIDGVLFDKSIRTLISYPQNKNQRTYVIPSSVTSIEVNAFGCIYSGCSSLTNVTIPSSVTSIGDGAFYNCKSLTSITIPSSVTSIGDRVFSDCSSLTSVIIPSSVTYIGNSAFSSCSSLTSVTIPSSVTYIDDYAFSSCSSLTNITIPSSVTSIGICAFIDCSSLTNVIIPSSVTSMGYGVFANCSSLTSVTLSRRTQVGERAFPESARIIYRD